LTPSFPHAGQVEASLKGIVLQVEHNISPHDNTEPLLLEGTTRKHFPHNITNDNDIKKYQVFISNGFI
jgi:hypothetical protein